ncbi:MAG: hypothetical protein IJR45_06715, partial [Firmicutes bacterium]|nr:hypothetical protein [Bacillota bacterium]
DYKTLVLSDDEAQVLIDAVNLAVENGTPQTDVHDEHVWFHNGSKNIDIWFDGEQAGLDESIYDYDKSAHAADFPFVSVIFDKETAETVKELILRNSGIDITDTYKSAFLTNGIEDHKITFIPESSHDTFEITLDEDKEQAFLELICDDLDRLYDDITLQKRYIEATGNEDEEDNASGCDYDIEFESYNCDISIHTECGNMRMYSKKHGLAAEMDNMKLEKEQTDAILKILNENIKEN